MEKEDFYARFEGMGVDKVREGLNLGHISGRGVLPAQEWLRQCDAHAAELERAERDKQSAEERRIARSAKNAAWAAAIAAIVAAIAAIVAAVIAYHGAPA
jgi:hypothetical protein